MYFKRFLDVNLHYFDSSIFIPGQIIAAHPHLNIVSGGVWKLLVEPWRSVEGAACVLQNIIRCESPLLTTPFKKIAKTHMQNKVEMNELVNTLVAMYNMYVYWHKIVVFQTEDIPGKSKHRQQTTASDKQSTGSIKNAPSINTLCMATLRKLRSRDRLYNIAACM